MHHNPSSTPPPPELGPSDLYINRELSWIEFNNRVFEEARDSRNPLLERVKFLSIFDTNLDEFLMIRLAGLKDKVAAHVTTVSADGRTAEQQLAAIRKLLAPVVQDVRRYWASELLPLLAEEHIYILDYEQLNEEQQAAMTAYFESEIFPVLTPLAVDSGHPFPHISNRSLNLAVVVTDPVYGERFARVKVPPALPRFIPVPVSRAEKGTPAAAFVWIEQVIAVHLSRLFPGIDVWESYPFRVLRDADIELQEDEASDLLEDIEKGVRDRRFGCVVDLAVNPSMPPRVRAVLLDNLEIDSNDLTIIDGPLGMVDLMELQNQERPELKYPPFIPRNSLEHIHDGDLFAAIRERDLLLHHPYDSFNSVVDFIRFAAHDPNVLAIKQTLYRVGTNAPVVNMLLEAVENGKQVAVLVELKARFDEENNIEWARALEHAGVHVVYGLIRLKTHAKVALVVRKEADGLLRRYVHLGTGNYNASTARVYEDLCLLTCDREIGEDVSDLFNTLTGYSRLSTYRKLLVAPVSLRRSIIERIEREIEVHKEHGNGHLIFKINSLVDPATIEVLYRASQAGVRIDLIVRGICCLRPGIPGISETIRVRSLVGRFLEHSRVYYFGNGDDPETYLGSADLMQRNLDARVETLFPIEDPALGAAIRTNLLDRELADTSNARELLPAGCYERVRPEPGEQPFDSQAWFLAHPLVDFGGDDLNNTVRSVPSGA